MVDNTKPVELAFCNDRVSNQPSIAARTLYSETRSPKGVSEDCFLFGIRTAQQMLSAARQFDKHLVTATAAICYSLEMVTIVAKLKARILTCFLLFSYSLPASSQIE